MSAEHISLRFTFVNAPSNGILMTHSWTLFEDVAPTWKPCMSAEYRVSKGHQPQIKKVVNGCG